MIMRTTMLWISLYIMQARRWRCSGGGEGVSGHSTSGNPHWFLAGWPGWSSPCRRQVYHHQSKCKVLIHHASSGSTTFAADNMQLWDWIMHVFSRHWIKPRSINCPLVNFHAIIVSQRQLHTASLMGFIRNGCRWGWKLGVFSGLFR